MAVVGVVMAAVPVLSAEGAQSGDTCLGLSTGSISTSTPSVMWHGTVQLSWQVSLRCPSPLRGYTLQLAGPQGVHQEVSGNSGSNMFVAWTTGPWQLQLVNQLRPEMAVLASVDVTVIIPGPLPTGVTSVDITHFDLVESRWFVSAIQTPGVTVRVAGGVDMDISGLEFVHIASGVSIIGDRSVNPKGPRLFTQSYPKMLFMIGDGYTPADGVRISGLRLEGAENDDPFSGGSIRTTPTRSW